MRINPSEITTWQRATKTKTVKAKALINLLVDRTVTNKFLVDTLEGNEPLGDGVVICVGEAGDVWQQTPKKLLQKYNVASIDSDGWMVCEPRPDNSVRCFQVPLSITEGRGAIGNTIFEIVGLWGATIGGEKNIQMGVAGDYICQNESDESDVWIVKKKIFENTYQIL
jgi:hypothetical protein